VLACRGIELAGRLGIPVVTFVDTPGAALSPEAENQGIARAIARTHAAMAATPVPTVSVCVGEGGSGGAQALSAADRLLIQKGAIFSVIGPEGAAAILERDAAKAPEVAPLLRLTSADLVGFGIADAVVPDGLDPTVQAVDRALGEAVPGDRARRLDAATAAWLVG
jgi:acetyl-CoA carboxylase carboxyl transferase subunit beta